MLDNTLLGQLHSLEWYKIFAISVPVCVPVYLTVTLPGCPLVYLRN